LQTEVRVIHKIGWFSLCCLAVFACYRPVFSQEPSSFLDLPGEVSDGMTALLHDPASYLTRRYRWQADRVEQYFKGRLPLTEGLEINEGNWILTVDVTKRPELSPMHRFLASLQDHFGSDLPGMAKDRLLAHGFPHAELAHIEATRTEAGSLEAFHKARAIKHAHQSLALHESDLSPEFLRRWQSARWLRLHEARRDWSIWFLERFSPGALKALMLYLEENDLGVSKVNYARRHPNQAMIDAILEARQRAQARRHWPVGEAPTVSLEPPDMLWSRNGVSPVWIKADALTYDEEQGLRFRGAPLLEVMPEITATGMNRRMNLLRAEKQKYAPGKAPDCLTTYNGAHAWPPDSLLEITKNSTGVFTATVEASNVGFCYDQPASLLTLKVANWLRKPLSGAKDHLYLYLPNTRFEIEYVPFCARNIEFPESPSMGTRVLVFSAGGPGDQAGCLLYLPSSLIIWETENGSTWISPKLKEGLPGEAPSFDQMIETAKRLVATIPYRTLGEGWE
jgi:hypothetical protein